MSEWEMTFSGPHICLATDYGAVYVTWTDRGHCHVSPRGRKYPHNETGITYRGRAYRNFSVHLFAASGWDEDPQDDQVSSHRDLFAPVTYRAAIVAAIRTAVIAYIRDHPALLVAAQRNSLVNALESATKEISNAHAVLTVARADHDRISAELRALEREAESCPTH